MKRKKKTLSNCKTSSIVWICSALMALHGCARPSPDPHTKTAPKVADARLDTFQGRGKLIFVEQGERQTIAFQAVGQCGHGLHMQWSVLGISVAALWLDGTDAFVFIPKEQTVYQLQAREVLLPWTQNQWTQAQMLAMLCYRLQDVDQWAPEGQIQWDLSPDQKVQVIQKISWPDTQASVAYAQFPYGDIYPRSIAWRATDDSEVQLIWKNIIQNPTITSDTWKPSWPEDVPVVQVKEPFSIWHKTR
jgi:hypothetical protein